MTTSRPIILIALLAAVASASAQQPKTATPKSDERTVLDLEDAWARGVVKRDAATFKRLLAPGFVYTEDDRVETGDQVVHDIVSGTDTVTSAVNEQLATHSFGNT